MSTTALTLTHSYKEDPGVRKVKRGYSRFPAETLSGAGGRAVDALMFAIIQSLCTLAVAHGAAGISNKIGVNIVGWSVAVMVIIGLAVIGHLLAPVALWALKSPTSPINVNKVRRANIEKAKTIAQQLGASVVPVLTGEHLTAIQKVHDALIWTIRLSGVDRDSANNPKDYDRIAVLLLEDLNREAILTNIISERAISTMDQVESILRQIETETVAPLREGWL